MKLLIQHATIIDPKSEFHKQQMDILIENGIILEIAKELTKPSDAIQFTANNLHVSPGWCDMNANFRDPGMEYKEDLNSGMMAAAAGGFTSVAVMPGTHPPIQNKADIEFITKRSEFHIVDLYPIGALTKDLKGKEITEMYDMHLSGAVAFSNDNYPVENPKLINIALLYTKNFGGLMYSLPRDVSLSKGGQVNESDHTTALGMTGIPAISELLPINRDICLASYTGSRIHFSAISAKESVAAIREAKKKGIGVTASVAAHQLFLDDSLLESFDSNLKVYPPLRDKTDIEALLEGLRDGTIDSIISKHEPEDIESKKCEFNNAAFGLIGLETTYAVSNTTGKLDTETLINKLAISPREILDIAPASIVKGEKAELTLFDPTLEWVFTEKDIRSKSRNTPFINKKLTGKVLGIFNNSQFHKN